MVSRIKAWLPSAAEPFAIGVWYFFRPVVRILFFGRARHCPVCRSHCRKFLAHGPPSRRVRDVVCPVCLSHPRHRLAWIFLTTRTNLLDGLAKTVLHFAPEPAFAVVLRRARGIETVSADLDSPHAMVKLDITRIDRPPQPFGIHNLSNRSEPGRQNGNAIPSAERKYAARCVALAIEKRDGIH